MVELESTKTAQAVLAPATAQTLQHSKLPVRPTNPERDLLDDFRADARITNGKEPTPQEIKEGLVDYVRKSVKGLVETRAPDPIQKHELLGSFSDRVIKEVAQTDTQLAISMRKARDSEDSATSIAKEAIKRWGSLGAAGSKDLNQEAQDSGDIIPTLKSPQWTL